MLIAIEGIDGVGKATQTKLLADALATAGKECVTFEFPNYKKSVYGQLLGECLAGKRGDFANMDPRVASTLYMVDRHEAAPEISAAIERDAIVVCDRFNGSNQIHQGGKVASDEERIEILNWLDHAEHDVLGNPRPDVVVYLDAPVDLALQLLEQKRAAKGTILADGESDQVEKDRNYLDNSYRMARWIAERDPVWHLIDCTDGQGGMRSRESIHEEVLGIIRPLLV